MRFFGILSKGLDHITESLEKDLIELETKNWFKEVTK